jgi:cellobiose-specific phosphotransferase system component IIC
MRALKRTVIVLVIVALAVIVVAAGLPWFVHIRTTSAVNACMNNLLQLDRAKNQWALEGSKTTNDTPSWEEIWPYLGSGGTNGITLTCPKGGTYILGRVGEHPRCSMGGLGHTLE